MPATKPLTPVRTDEVRTLADVKIAVRALVADAEALLPALAALKRDGALMTDPHFHHQINTFEGVLIDTTLRLSDALKG